MTLHKIGFIGLGHMGLHMARNLMAKGFALTVCSRRPEAAETLTEQGAGLAASPEELARGCDAVITVVGRPQDVREVYFGERGLFAGFSEGKILIDMTTSSPALAVKIAAEAARLGGAALDAPISGGEKGAREGTLSIMAGGDRTAFERALPLFQALGKTIIHQGGPGFGHYTKLTNQIAVACNMLGVCESLSFAQRAGLDMEQAISSLMGGTSRSRSMESYAQKVVDGDFAPGFYVKHFVKDMGIALDAAQSLELSLPALQLAHRLYSGLAEQGGELQGIQSLFREYVNQ